MSHNQASENKIKEVENRRKQPVHSQARQHAQECGVKKFDMMYC